MHYSAAELATLLNGMLTGDPGREVSGLNFIDRARADEMTFIGSAAYISRWAESPAGVALVGRGLNVEPGDGRAIITVDNADLAMARALELFAPPPPLCEPGIHPSAVVDPSALIGEDCCIGPCCVVGPRASIGAGSVLYAHVTVMDDSVIGPQCTLWPGVVIRERCRVGSVCILHLNVSIGADGFGYRPDPDGAGIVKIPQIGTVELGSAVEIGANSAVDRGKFGATSIGDGTKIDNLVQIAHNCRIGRCCLIAASCAIAGSVTIGDGVLMGGCVAVKDHLSIGAGARIGGGSGLIRDVPAGASVLGYPGMDSRQCLRSWAAIAKLGNPPPTPPTPKRRPDNETRGSGI